jgi:hypothetical protein
MAKDLYHLTVKNALLKDGWQVTHDPFSLSDKATNLDYEIDLGAEKLIIAEKGIEKIAVEVKSFLKASLVYEFHAIFGQYLIYIEGLKRMEPDRKLYLALSDIAYERLLEYPFLLDVIKNYKVHLIVYNIENQSIVAWK